jgi:hypothetical protein
MHTIFPTALTVIFDVQRDVAISIGKPTLNPELLDLHKRALVFDASFALGVFEPGVEAAGKDL